MFRGLAFIHSEAHLRDSDSELSTLTLFVSFWSISLDLLDATERNDLVLQYKNADVASKFLQMFPFNERK